MSLLKTDAVGRSCEKGTGLEQKLLKIQQLLFGENIFCKSCIKHEFIPVEAVQGERSSYKVRIVFAEMDKNLDVYFIIGTER